MASQANTIVDSGFTDIESIVGVVTDLQNVLARLDKLGLSHAGAMLAGVLDLLIESVSDSNERVQAIQS